MTSYRQKRKAPPGGAGRARADTAGGQLTASTVILSRKAQIVKCDADAGAVTIVLRLNERPQVCIDAMQESDALALLPLAERARRLAALLEAP